MCLKTGITVEIINFHLLAEDYYLFNANNLPCMGQFKVQQLKTPPLGGGR